jgi:tetratricopeptide (TPR) repeat protein
LEGWLASGQELVEKVGAGMNTNSRPAVVRTFMTHDMTDADIVAVSTGREEEFRRIIAAVNRSRSATPGALQHVVLYGSRGFGKSFMMRRVEIALQQTPPDNKPIIFLLLPEEQHNLQKSPHAFLDYITVLLTKTEGDEAFAEAMFQWPKPGEAARRWKESAAKLEAALESEIPGGQGLVVVAVENFDSLLATLFADDEDEQRLRDWLFRQKNRVMLIATATGTVDMDYDKPLFQAFESVRLQPWTTDDCITYFNRKRESEGKPPLNGRQEAKARAVAEFIGGTPRLAQLLAEVIETEDALTVAETMNALADRLAEYYRRRIEDLAPLVRGLLDALIRGGEPASQTQLAERVGAAGQSQIARAMSDLQTADIIRGRPAPDSRETLYAVTDRVFAHYYRRRQGSRVAQETPLASILDFLRSFYDRAEQKQQGLRHLLEGRLAEGALFSRLAMEELTEHDDEYIEDSDKRLSLWLSISEVDFGRTEDLITRLTLEPQNVHHECKAVQGSLPVDDVILSVLRAQALYRLGHKSEAATELLSATEIRSENLLARVIGFAELMRFRLFSGIEREKLSEDVNALTNIDLRNIPAHLKLYIYRLLAWAFDELGRHQDSLLQIRFSIDLADTLEINLERIANRRLAGMLLSKMERHEEVLEHTRQAIELALETSNKIEELLVRRRAGFSLDALKRHEEALIEWERMIVLAQDLGDKHYEADARRFAAWSLDDLDRHYESLRQWEQVIELAHELNNERDEMSARRNAGRCLNEINQYDEALTQLERAIEFAREFNDHSNLCWSVYLALNSASFVAAPEIISMFGEWLEVFRNLPEELLPDPRLEVAEFLTAATRAGKLATFDEIIAEYGDWLIGAEPVLFLHHHGAALADIATRGDRATGWQSVADFLTRAARVQGLAPEKLRDKTWLSDLMTGFVQKCRDPGLLRDVAGLLTPELSPEAEPTCGLLLDLARVDEAVDTEQLLARMDPDRALVIRRLRDLPDPEPPRPTKSGKRKRR